MSKAKKNVKVRDLKPTKDAKGGGAHSLGAHSAGAHSAGAHSLGAHSAGAHSAGAHSAGGTRNIGHGGGHN